MKVRFLDLVQMFQMQGYISLGKLKNPMSDTIDKNLEQAQYFIDVLSMLEEKTTGNLSDEEKRMLAYSLQDLRLNYVDESTKSAGEIQ